MCGRHPNLYPWHFQWHVTKDLHIWQKKVMWNLEGKILDVGCGNKPYQNWINPLNLYKYIGLDVIHGNDVDVLVTPTEIWPLESKGFDCVIMAQVIEHVEDLSHTMSEVTRVLKDEGTLIITVPFIYPVHGIPYDFRRFTTYGIESLLNSNYKIMDITSSGKLGSVLASLLLIGIENNFNCSFLTRLVKGIVLPVWIFLSFIVNVVCLLINLIDVRKTHYCNVCVVAKKTSS